ncbi:hypothetical protein OC834_003813 [Tilletia horrida]|nr:hypothetical protein OC834_003813 [Tilletia horrida]
MSTGTRLVQYDSDSESERSAPEVEREPTATELPPSRNAPGSSAPAQLAHLPGGMTVIPRSVLQKRNAVALSSSPPPAKKARVDQDPFGLANAASAARPTKAVNSAIDASSSLPAASAVKDWRAGALSLPPGKLDTDDPTAAARSPSPRPEAHDGVGNTATEAAEDDGIPFGWAQDPDGTLYPVTPQAHEQYAQWQAAQKRAQEAEAATKKASSDGKGGAMPSYSAADLANSSRSGGAASSSALDSKYAAAAAAVAGEADGQPAARGKAVNFRARNKGQLSAVLAMANERRDELEEKYAKGRDRQRDARQRYGF